MKLSNKRITKALIGLHKCAGWFAPVIFAKFNPRRQVSSLRGPNMGGIFAPFQGADTLPCTKE